MKQNKHLANELQHLDGITTGEAAIISEMSRKADVEEAARLRAMFSKPNPRPSHTLGDEFEQRIMSGPTDADLKQLEREEAAQRWREREMSLEELQEQEKWDIFAYNTAAKAVRSHRIIVKEKKVRPKHIAVNIVPTTPGISAAESMLEVNAHFHHKHNSGEIDKAS